jgi:sigma-B regulation protein RsbU (phosphoserine phosphatase)
MTAWGSVELAVEAMRRGACDFVLKPWENERLTKTLREQAEASRQRRFQATSLGLRDEFAEHERTTATRVQQRLFPSQAPSLTTLQCAALCKQAGAVGGDYYDFLDAGAGRLGFVLADVCGKGIAAALLMANLQATLRSRFPSFVDDLPRLLHDVNELFCRATQPEHYASLFLGVYDELSRRLRYVNCGHFPPLVLRAGGGLEKLDATATALGMFDAVTIEVGEIELRAGDLLVAYSDGAVETRGGDGEEFGPIRLAESCKRYAALAAEAIPAAVAEEILLFGRQEDDLTMVVGKVS